MAKASSSLAKQPWNPNTPSARPPPQPGLPRRVQDTVCATCGNSGHSGHMAHCRLKRAPKHEQSDRPTNESILKAKGKISGPDFSDKYRVHRSASGMYSKPGAKVKLIPAEDIISLRHGKPFGKSFSSAGLQRKYCRQSATPPPSSRKVSVLKSTSLTQNPVHSAQSINSCVTPRRLETIENGGDHVSRSLTPRIVSLKNPASPSGKFVPLGQSSGASLITNDAPPKNLSRMDSRKAFTISCSSSILNCQGQRSAPTPASERKDLVRSSTSPGPKHVCAAHSSEAPLGTKARPSSKSVSTCENGKLCSRSCNLAIFQCQYTRSATPPVMRPELTVDPALLSPKSVLSEQYIKVSLDTKSGSSPSSHFFGRKCSSASLLCETIIPPSPSPKSTLPAQYIKLSNDSKVGSSDKSFISAEKGRNKKASTKEVHCDNIDIGEVATPVILHTKLHKKRSQLEACWKGSFEVFGEPTHTYDGLEAHFPCEVFCGVYEISKQMPEILKLEPLPLSRLWPKMFKLEPPHSQDIGLYFSSNLQRPNRSFDHLLERISSHIGLHAYIGNIELVIYSSVLLTTDCQRRDGKFYFWGVFRRSKKKLRKEQSHACGYTSNMEISKTGPLNEDSRNKSEDGMKLDVTGGKERQGVKEHAPIQKTPGSNAATEPPSQRRPAGSCIVLDTPPGFPLDVPPGFTKAHCRLPAGAPAESATIASPSVVLDTPRFPLDVPPGFTKAHCRFPAGAPAGSVTVASSSVVLDTTPGFPLDVPPGFTEAHRWFQTKDPTGSTTIASIGTALDNPPRLSFASPPGFSEAHHRLPVIASVLDTAVCTPASEKKPLIKFSLKVSRPIKTELPPGLKKEAGSPATDKDTEKRRPTLVSGASSIRTAVKVGVKIEHNEVKVTSLEEPSESPEESELQKTRLISDILECLSNSANENTGALSKSPPKNWSEVLDKIQGMETPEKQQHCRKRGLQEACQPSLADTTKRLKVNGRIALSKASDHRRLSSNQEQV